MNGLVLELQRDALDGASSVTTLLRKALVISQKLGVKTISEWLNFELNGYPDGQEVPQYRMISGRLKAFNPYRGWMPVNFQDDKTAKAYQTTRIHQKVGELESLANCGERHLQVSVPHAIVNSVRESIGFDFDVTLHLQIVNIAGILEGTRNHILDFALQLEKDGILGDGMSFSAREKEVAAGATYNITNNIGHMSHSQIQQCSSGTQRLDIVDGLRKLLPSLQDIANDIQPLGLASESQAEFIAEVATLKAQADSPKPKPGIIRESLQSLRTILEGATGAVVATVVGDIVKLVGG